MMFKLLSPQWARNVQVRFFFYFQFENSNQPLQGTINTRSPSWNNFLNNMKLDIKGVKKQKKTHTHIYLLEVEGLFSNYYTYIDRKGTQSGHSFS